MSCGMPMHNAASAANSEAAAPEQARFYADLANGLHAMAQPLTILRSTMEVLALPAEVGIDKQRYLEISTQQVRRTCEMFTSLQDLVTARVIEAQRLPFDLWELVSPLIEGRRKSLLAGGIGIAMADSEPWGPIRGDAGRTEQALVAVLNLASSIASRGDVIELRAAQADGFLELTVENTRRHGKRMDSSDRLSLSAAEANILSQHGRYVVVEDPFCVSLALPIEESHRVSGGAGLSNKDARPLH